jgi:GGDEF domain-containing protein
MHTFQQPMLAPAPGAATDAPEGGALLVGLAAAWAAEDVGALGHVVWSEVPGLPEPVLIRDGAAADLADGGTTGPERLVADITGPHGWYGRMVAVVDGDGPALPSRHQLLAAHGAAAGAALDGVARALGRGDDPASTYALATELLGMGDAVAVAGAVAAAVPAATGADRVAVYLCAADGDVLDLVATAGPTALRARPLRPTDAPQLARLLAQPGPHVLDAAGGPGVAPARLAGAGTEWAAVAPIVGGDRFLGALVAGWTSARTSDDEAALARIVDLAGMAGGTLARVRAHDDVRHQTAHDPVTGLLGARAFHERATAALDGAASPALVVCRLDRLGGPTTDEGLRAAASTITRAVRRTDVVARTGPATFAVLLADVGTPADASAKATRLVNELRRLGPLGVQPSVGIAVPPVDGRTLDDLLAAAGA